MHQPTPPAWVSPLLLIAGLYNVAGSATMLVAADQIMPLLFANQAAPIDAVLRFHFTALWLFVGIVGVVLLLGRRAPREQRGVMLLSALGKLAFVGLVLAYWLAGTATSVLLLASLGDLALGAGLLAAWWALRGSVSPAN